MTSYHQGYEDGKNDGYNEGFASGQLEVKDDHDRGYREGFEAGKAWKIETREEIIENAHKEPTDEVKVASSIWYDHGYTSGHRAGKRDGTHEDRYDEGYKNGKTNKDVEQEVWLDMGEEWGKEHDRYEFMMEIAVAEMLLADDLFICLGMQGYKSTELLVNANDVFAWACGDSEPLPAYDIKDYYTNVFKSNERFISTKWVCKHRGMKPQGPIVRDMKLAGVWDDEMEALDDNSN